jgi:hypothetical protein
MELTVREIDEHCRRGNLISHTLKCFGSDLLTTEALDFCSNAFSSRERVSTSLRNALVRGGIAGSALQWRGRSYPGDLFF